MTVRWLGSSALVIAALSTACAFFNPAAESSLRIAGRVENASRDTPCTLRLLTENGRAVETRTVTAEVAASFTIGPGAHKFYVEISCAGQRGLYRSAVRRVDASTQIWDLGKVTLQ